jgi:hypothetical protein
MNPMLKEQETSFKIVEEHFGWNEMNSIEALILGAIQGTYRVFTVSIRAIWLYSSIFLE